MFISAIQNALKFIYSDTAIKKISEGYTPGTRKTRPREGRVQRRVQEGKDMAGVRVRMDGEKREGHGPLNVLIRPCLLRYLLCVQLTKVPVEKTMCYMLFRL